MSLGEQLKLIREEEGLGLEELSDVTKIQVKYLNSLENEEYDKLPNPVYIRGFIQKWARACSADPEPLLMHFYRENKPLINSNANDTKVKKTNPTGLIITSRHIIGALTIVAVLSLVAYFYYNQKALASAPEIEVTSPTEVNIVTEDQIVIFEGNALNAQELLINGEQVQVLPEGKFRHEYELQEGLNDIIIKAVNEEGEEVEAIRKIMQL